LKKISQIILLLITTIFIGCGGDSAESITPTPKEKAINTLDQNMTEAYQMYVEKSLSQRVVSYKLFEELVDKDLTPLDKIAIKKMLQNYVYNEFETEYYIDKYQKLVYKKDEFYTQKENLELVMISLSAMLIRYDNYILSYTKYHDNERLNTELNYRDDSYDIPAYTLQDIVDQYYGDDEYEDSLDRDNILAMISYYDRNVKLYKDDTNTFFIYLRTLIEDSPSYRLGLEENSILSWILDGFYEFLDDVWSSFFGTVSENIGNTAGLVESREGKLYKDDAVTAYVERRLTAGDILLERTPFRLTDKLIPGYWGHVAVYIGTKDELVAMGIWDDLNVIYNSDTNRTYQDDYLNIEDSTNPRNIVEALRDGVQLNSVKHFLNVDDLAIMHDENESFSNRVERIKEVIKQLGKEYDFEYDIEDNSKIICSELVYISSIYINWDTEHFAGISTISPDNVAIKSTELDTVFSLSLMYIDGELVTSDEKAVMTKILEEYEE